MATPINTNLNTDGAIGASGSVNFSTLVPQIIEKFIGVLEGALIIAIGYYLIRYFRSQLSKIEIAHAEQKNAINLLEKITSGFIIVVSITIALKIIGIDMTLLVSVAILGLSYGLQDIIKNYVAGILILFKAPFKIGDTVKIREFTGKVAKMDFQATTLQTFDNKQITIYNSDVMTQSIMNFSNSNMRRIDVDVMLGYGTDTTKALAVFEKILSNNPSVLKSPKYSIIFKKFTDTSIEVTLKCWVQRPCNILQIKSQIGVEISRAFDEEQIYMPYVKGIEAESDFSLSETRKKRNQAFYSQPLFADTVVNNPALAPEVIQLDPDSEEPE